MTERPAVCVVVLQCIFATIYVTCAVRPIGYCTACVPPPTLNQHLSSAVRFSSPFPKLFLAAKVFLASVLQLDCDCSGAGDRTQSVLKGKISVGFMPDTIAHNKGSSTHVHSVKQSPFMFACRVQHSHCWLPCCRTRQPAMCVTCCTDLPSFLSSVR